MNLLFYNSPFWAFVYVFYFALSACCSFSHFDSPLQLWLSSYFLQTFGTFVKYWQTIGPLFNQYYFVSINYYRFFKHSDNEVEVLLLYNNKCTYFIIFGEPVCFGVLLQQETQNKLLLLDILLNTM